VTWHRRAQGVDPLGGRARKGHATRRGHEQLAGGVSERTELRETQEDVVVGFADELSPSVEPRSKLRWAPQQIGRRARPTRRERVRQLEGECFRLPVFQPYRSSTLEDTLS
jgi:hypothetical protein